jgi:hypothetical protein
VRFRYRTPAPAAEKFENIKFAIGLPPHAALLAYDVTGQLILEGFIARDRLGHWLPGTTGNAGGRPKPPDGLRTRLAELSPQAVARLAELLDSADERVRLEAAKTILDRHLGRPGHPGGH